MTRTFKKRLLALVLTLALCTALMLPGFAATIPEDEGAEVYSTNACPQHDPRFNRAEYSYIDNGPTHTRLTYNVYFCQLCHTEEWHETSYVKGLLHTGNPCVCGHKA